MWRMWRTWRWMCRVRRSPGRARARRPPWLLALALLFMLPLAACASGRASKAVLRVTPTVTPTIGPTPTPTPCVPATQWQPPAGNVGLDSLSMVSPSEGWATGIVNPMRFDGRFPSAAVLYHLVNGQWRRLPQTYPGAELKSLSMDSPSDGWAASPTPMNASKQPLVLHYTGGVWRQVDVPALDAVLRPTATVLEADINTISVRMFGAQAGWMFAQTNRDSDTEGGPRSLVLRFEGGAWTLVPGPQVVQSVTLFDFSAVSVDEAWMMGTDTHSGRSTTVFYHYINGGWAVAPETFPFGAWDLTMLSTDDGWAATSASASVTASVILLHYDGVRWAKLASPSAWSAQDVTPAGLVFATGPGVGVTWMVTYTPDAIGLWQDAHGHWSQVAWPYQDMTPLALAPGALGEVWGIGDINHVRGCAPALVIDIPQGVFLHEVHGTWTRQVLP